MNPPEKQPDLPGEHTVPDRVRGRRARLAIPIAVGLSAALAACREPAPPTTQPTPTPAVASASAHGRPDRVRQPRVDPSERESPRLRLVSMAPQVTEIVCALGLANQLVGRTTYCNYPPEIEQVPALGALVDTNIEALAGLRPDLILVSGRSALQAERLRGADLRFESVPDVHLNDVFKAIRQIGDLTGRRRTAAALCEAIQADLETIRGSAGRVGGTSVILVVGVLGDPPAAPFAAGPGSFYDELLGLLGARNVSGLDVAFGTLSLESILAADPDVIIELDPDGTHRRHGDADALIAWRRVGDLTAVKRERVRVIVGPQHYLAGPRIAETLDALLRALSTPP